MNNVTQNQVVQLEIAPVAGRIGAEVKDIKKNGITPCSF